MWFASSAEDDTDDALRTEAGLRWATVPELMTGLGGLALASKWELPERGKEENVLELGTPSYEADVAVDPGVEGR